MRSYFSVPIYIILTYRVSQRHSYDHIGDEDFYVRGVKKTVDSKLGRVVTVGGE